MRFQVYLNKETTELVKTLADGLKMSPNALLKVMIEKGIGFAEKSGNTTNEKGN